MNKIIPISLLTVSLLIVVTAVNAISAGVEITTALNLENITITPDRVYPGSNFTLTGTVRDITDRELDSVRLTVQGGFPFSKTSPLSSFYIDKLPSNQAYQFSIPLNIDKDASNQQYTLQITGEYVVYDPAISRLENTTNSQTLTATVKVDKGVDFKIVDVSFPQPIVADMKNGEIVLRVQNTGVNIAKEVQLNLAAQYPFTPTGKSYFINEIQAGQTGTATFHIDVDSAASMQNYPLDMTIKWKEGNNQYSDIKTFGIPVNTNNTPFSLSNLLQINNLILYLLVLAAIAGFVLWKKKIKKKSKR